MAVSFQEWDPRTLLERSLHLHVLPSGLLRPIVSKEDALTRPHNSIRVPIFGNFFHQSILEDFLVWMYGWQKYLEVGNHFPASQENGNPTSMDQHIVFSLNYSDSGISVRLKISFSTRMALTKLSLHI